MGKLLIGFAFYCKIKMMLSIKTIILFIVMLSSITLVHELGHLLVAKAFGVYCKEFAIGMGPTLYSKTFKETKYSIRAILIGGFVSMAGETEQDDEDAEKLNIPYERTLKGVAKWKQLLIMFAGIFMNFVMALVIYSLLILNVGTYSIASKPQIESIREEYPAFNSGLQVGDVIVKAELSNGMSIEPESYSELTTFLTSYYEGEGYWTLTVDRSGKQYQYQITPKYYPSEDRYIIGISFSDVSTKSVDINIFNCFKYGFIYMMSMVKMIFTSFVALFRGIGLKNLSGPIGVYQVVQQTIEYGFEYYIELLALISINVAVFNAIPLPAFDGGRAFLLLIEIIIGKPLPKKFETAVLAGSWAVIIMLMLVVGYNDIVKIIGG